MQSKYVLIISALVEKLFWTFIEVGATFALAQETLGVDTQKAAAMAGLAAVGTVILGLLTDWAIPDGTPFGVLVIVRTFRTFTVSVLALVLNARDLDLFNMEMWQFAVVSAIPAVLATLKGLAASRLGDPNVPATLPATFTTAA